MLRTNSPRHRSRATRRIDLCMLRPETAEMSWQNTPNKSAQYRARAAEARAKAESTAEEAARDMLLQEADTWERMAAYEDKNNPPRPMPGSV
jgi:hypothetical protein